MASDPYFSRRLNMRTKICQLGYSIDHVRLHHQANRNDIYRAVGTEPGDLGGGQIRTKIDAAKAATGSKYGTHQSAHLMALASQCSE